MALSTTSFFASAWSLISICCDLNMLWNYDMSGSIMLVKHYWVIMILFILAQRLSIEWFLIIILVLVISDKIFQHHLCYFCWNN
jgi:hypothetical protein